MNKKLRIPIELFISWSICYSIIYTGKAAASDILLTSHSVFTLVLFSLIYILVRHQLTLFIHQKSFPIYAVSLIFSLMMVIGQDIYEEGILTYSFSGLLDILYRVLSLTILFGLLIQKLFIYFSSKFSVSSLSDSKPHKRWKIFLFYWGIIFLCWFPVFLAFYPGIFAYDTPLQMWQSISHEYTTHHPLLHTLYLGTTVLLGASIHSYNFGIALYSISQMLLLSAIFSCICCYLHKWKLPRLIQIIALVFFALHPLNSMFSISATKDVLFAGFFALVFAQITDFLLYPETLNLRIKKLFYSASIVLLCLFRNNGIYVMLFLIPFLLAFKNKQKWKLFRVTLVGIVFYLITNTALTTFLHAANGSIAEMLSVPMQQLALVYNTEEDLEPEYRDAIEYYISPDTLVLYNGFISDPVKDGFNEDAFFERTKNFLYMWITLGIRYPADYINAFLTLTLGNWYPDMNYPNIHPYMETEVKDMWGQLPMYRDSKLPWLEMLYSSFRTEVPQQELPVISMLFSPGILIWIVILAMGYYIYMQHRRFILPLCLCLGLWGTNMLGPIALMRYSYPIFCCIPLIISTAILISRNKTR